MMIKYTRGWNDSKATKRYLFVDRIKARLCFYVIFYVIARSALPDRCPAFYINLPHNQGLTLNGYRLVRQGVIG